MPTQNVHISSAHQKAQGATKQQPHSGFLWGKDLFCITRCIHQHSLPENFRLCTYWRACPVPWRVQVPEPSLPLSWLWSLRHGGDIIVIGLEKDSGAQRGRVIAVLKARELNPHG